MKKTCRNALVALGCLISPACGPVMDLRDALHPERVGSMTPFGQIKHDFWGNRYIEPYPVEMTKPNSQATSEMPAEERK